MESELLKTALTYYDNGLQLIPLQKQSKIPLGAWKELLYKPETKDYITNTFQDDINIGIFGGIISQNAFFVDFDNKKTFEKKYKESKTLKDLINKTPFVESSRGYHLYLRYKEPIKTTANKSYGIDIKGQGGYIVAPPSLHPSGQRYLFQDGFKNIYEIQDLKEIDFWNIETFNGLDESRREKKSKEIPIIKNDYTFIQNNQNTLGIGIDLFTYLTTGKITIDYQKRHKNCDFTRSGIEYNIVLKCISNGWNLSEIQELFKRFAYSGSKVKERGGFLENELYPKAINYYKNNIRKTDKTINNLYNAVNTQFDFNNRTAWTDRAVYNAILEIGLKSNKISNIDLSIRELAISANLSNDTINRALKRLTEYNLIKQIKQSEDNAPRAYNLLTQIIDDDRIGHTITVFNNRDIKGNVNNYQTDYYIRGCLGKYGYKIIQEINNSYGAARFKETFTTSELSEKTNINLRTIQRVIEKLYNNDLILRVKNNRQYDYYIQEKITDDKLKELAKRMGTYGITEKRRAKIKQQRENYKAYLDEKAKKDAAANNEIIDSVIN